MSETLHSKTPAEVEASEPCPTPLVWQDVVQSFLDERREGDVDFLGGSLTVTQFGTGQPLVVLTGTVGSPRLFALTAWLLREEFQLWIFDRPRFQQRKTASEYIQASTDAYSSVVSELFDQPVDCYAPTLGAQVAIQMMLDSSEGGESPRLRKVALQSGWAHRDLTMMEKTLLGIGSSIPFRLRKVPFWLSTQIANHRPWFPPYDETRFGFLLAETYKTSVRDLSLRMRAAAKTDLSNSLTAIRNDVLLVRTEGDGQAIVTEQDTLEQNIPGCHSEWMHTCGHFPFLTHPHRLVKILRQFYQSET